MRVSSEWVRRGRGGKSSEGGGWMGGWDTFLLFMRATHAMEPTLGENIFDFSVKINIQTMAHQTSVN